MSSASSAKSCKTYSSSEGLNFTLYCDQDAKGAGDIGSVGAKSAEECMDLCAAKVPGFCAAASFDSKKEICFFKSRNITAEDAKPGDGITLGVAFAKQLEPLPLSCTANQTSGNGLDFSVYCNQDLKGSDMAKENRTHADTFGDCLDHCSTLHPLCTGVLWDSTLGLGWRNCLPKKDGKDNRKSSASTKGLQVGVANFGNTTNEDCRANSNGTATTGNDVAFKLTCSEDRFGSDIKMQHADSYQDCIDLCDKHTGDKCIGVVHDSKMVNGYENCYLKSAIGVATPDKDGYTFALRQDSPNSSNSSDPAPNPESSGPTSKAWIAGAVIGVLAAVILLLGFLWWRRKRSGKKDEEVQTPSYQEMDAQATLPYSRNELANNQQQLEKHPELGGHVFRHEMGSEGHQGVAELPAGMPSGKQ